MLEGARDERGTSSAIGVILLVAVVVILASAVGAFAFGFVGDATSEPQPSGFTAAQHGPFGDAEASGTIEFTMEAGDPVPADQLTVKVGGKPASNADVAVSVPGSKVTSGETIRIEQTTADGLDGGEEVLLVYESGDGGETTILHRVTANGGTVHAQSAASIFTAYEVGTTPGGPWSTALNNAPSDTAQNTNIEVTDAVSAVSDRSLLIQSGSYNPDNGHHARSHPNATVTVNLTGVDTVSFQTRGETSDFKLSVDDDQKVKRGELGNSGTWQTVSVDVSGTTGTKTVSFECAENTDDEGYSKARVYLDDVQFLDADGDRIPMSELLD